MKLKQHETLTYEPMYMKYIIIAVCLHQETFFNNKLIYIATILLLTSY